MSKVYRSCRWIVEKLTKHQRLSFDEINEMWMEDDDISNGAELNKRTFHRYQEVLKDVFGIKLLCLQTESYHRALSKHSERFRSADGDEPLRYASRTLVILRTMKGLRLARAGR